MTSAVTLHPRTGVAETSPNPLPQVMQTPCGLAILELQGTINLPDPQTQGGEANGNEIQIGHLSFPDYHPETQDASSTAWMKRVHLYVGNHQRLTGEVKKLPKAMAIIRKRPKSTSDVEMTDSSCPETTQEELEVVDIVKYKLMFSNRPEPVGTV